MNNWKIYTDGAYSSSLDQGGIGIAFLKNDELVYTHQKSFKHTTNNKMELIAVITALNAISKPIDSVIIYTDSMYVCGCANLNWQRKKNQELWKLFDKVYSKVSTFTNSINIVHVKGHNGDKYNEICDKLAVEASKDYINEK